MMFVVVLEIRSEQAKIQAPFTLDGDGSSSPYILITPHDTSYIGACYGTLPSRTV